MTIYFNPFDPESIDRAIKDINAFKRDFDKKIKRVMRKLQSYAGVQLQYHVGESYYDGDNSDFDFSVDKVENGFVASIRGSKVLFIEYGTGVYYNGGGRADMDGMPYSGPIPPGVVGIGEFGNGFGKRMGWGYTDTKGHHFTRGNPANAPMWKTCEETRVKLKELLDEEFKK